MPRLDAIAQRVRAKNAGPFWLTVDIFCGDAAGFAVVRDGLATARVAAAFNVAPGQLTRFDIADLNVVKFSLPRPVVQGSLADRDMHASQWAWLVAGLDVDD